MKTVLNGLRASKKKKFTHLKNNCSALISLHYVSERAAGAKSDRTEIYHILYHFHPDRGDRGCLVGMGVIEDVTCRGSARA